MTLAAAYVVTFVTLAAIDLAWLSVMAGRLYRPTLGDIARTDVNLLPAAAFYLLYPLGVMIFAVLPALRGGSLGGALTYGALFGFFCYATYDLTNHATLRNWTVWLTAVDVAWGCVLTAAAAAAGFSTASRMGSL